MNEFMKDRYGVDTLTTVMGVAGMILALVGSLTDIDPLLWGSIAVVVLALLRAFSKNIDARCKENAAFVGFTAKVPGLSSLIERLGSNTASTHTAGSTHSSADPAARKAEREARKAQLESQRNLAKKMWKQRKTHSFLKCPTCGQVLSVPKGKGKLIVTCPKCRTRMETKS